MVYSLLKRVISIRSSTKTGTWLDGNQVLQYLAQKESHFSRFSTKIFN